jgi:multiple sugar transport system permease protein
VFTALLAVLAVPGVILLIPKFLVLNQLGMYDTYPGWSSRCWSTPRASSS